MTPTFRGKRGRGGHNLRIIHMHSYLSLIKYTSSSRMRVIYHNWSAMKQRPHPQSVAEISHHSVLSGGRIRQCETYATKKTIGLKDGRDDMSCSCAVKQLQPTSIWPNRLQITVTVADYLSRSN